MEIHLMVPVFFSIGLAIGALFISFRAVKKADMAYFVMRAAGETMKEARMSLDDAISSTRELNAIGPRVEALGQAVAELNKPPVPKKRGRPKKKNI
jgi:hypothetical protein